MVKKERSLAFWSGAEVGLWHSVAYLAQAEALHTIAAGKVSKLRYNRSIVLTAHMPFMSGPLYLHCGF